MRKSIQLISSLYSPYLLSPREASLCVGHITKKKNKLKGDSYKRESKNSCLIPEKRVTSLLYIVIRTIQSTNFSETIVNNKQLYRANFIKDLDKKIVVNLYQETTSFRKQQDAGQECATLSKT